MSKNSASQHLSPEKYIRSRARNLAIGNCYINENWKEAGEAFITVTRRHVKGNVTFGIFLVDLYCMGVKDAGYRFNQTPGELDEFIGKLGTNSNSGMRMIEAEYVLVHNIIYGAVEFADENGIPPHKDFQTAKYLLEEDDERVPLIDIEFGHNGEPMYIGEE